MAHSDVNPWPILGTWKRSGGNIPELAIWRNSGANKMMSKQMSKQQEWVMAVESTWVGEDQFGSTNSDLASPDLGALVPRIGDAQPGLVAGRLEIGTCENNKDILSSEHAL